VEPPAVYKDCHKAYVFSQGTLKLTCAGFPGNRFDNL